MNWQFGKLKKVEPANIAIGQKGQGAQKVFNIDDEIRQMIDSPAFGDCVRAYLHSESGSTLEKMAFERIKKSGRTFEDWMLVYQSVPTTPAGIYAVEKMMVIAKTFKNWQLICEYITDDNTRSIAVDKMGSLAKTRDELIYVYSVSSPESATRITVDRALRLQARSVEDWESIADFSSGEMRDFAVNMMVNLTDADVDELDNLLSAPVIAHNDNHKEKVFEKVRALPLSFSKWMEVVKDENVSDDVKAIGVEKLINDPEMSSKGYADWLKVLDEAEEGSDFEIKAAVIVVDKAPTDDPVEVADLLEYSAIDNDSNLKEMILTKLRYISAEYYDKWKKIYENEDNDQSVLDIARDKMVEGITSFEGLAEVDETIREEDEDDDFNDNFEAKARAILISEEACRYIIDKYYADNSIFEIAAEWLIDRAKTTRECVDLVKAANDDWKMGDGEINSELFDKAIEKLLSVATPDEIHIMASLIGEDFDRLAEEATKKIRTK